MAKNIIITATLTGTKLGGFSRGFMAWGKENIAKLPKRDGEFIPVAVLHTADIVSLLVSRRGEYNEMTGQLILPDSVAIKSYQLMGLLAKGNTPEESAELATSEYDTVEHTVAYTRLAEALEASKEANIQLRITRQSELSGFDIVVPEEVVVQEGDILEFVNGITADGIKFANGMKGDYIYHVGKRHNGDLYAKRPVTSSLKAINALFTKTFNLVREIPNKKMDDVSGVF